MGLGVPPTPYLSYLPGAAVSQVYLGNGGQELGYTYVTVTTGNLPSAASAGAGARAWVSDATSRTFGANPTGGGSTIVPVWCDGTNWYIG